MPAMNTLALGAIFVVTPALALIQTVPSMDSQVSQLERTGLIGVLLIAVGYLARARDTDRTRADTQIASKDAALLASAEHVTAALVAQTVSNQELRKIIEKNDATADALRVSIERLGSSIGRLPCTDADTDSRK